MPDDILYPQGCRPVSEDLSADELIRRLKTLAHTLQAMEQDEGEGTAAQYIPLALQLAEDHFLQHESRDVQLLIACCIADVLRVYAPSAPYKDPERIKTIFLFLIKQLNGLKDPKDPAFKRYFYLLENLAYVKSFNMCFELEDCQEIFCNLFKVMFRIVNDEHSGKVKNFMLDMLCPLITESDLVSNELLDIILCNLLEPVKTQKKHAYLLAKELVIKTCDTLEQYIQAFFNNVLLLGREEKGFTVCKNVYNLIYELYNICPSVLLAVLPQLEVKLKSPDENQRMGAVSLLARMFSEKDSKLAQTHSMLWRAFLGRFNDINVNIRTKCVQYSVHFLTNHPELRSDITETLKLRQHDSDENVRYEVVMAIVVTAKRDFEVVSQSEDLLEFVKERMLDKKFKIRKEAMTGLAYIYKMHLSDSDVPQATKKAVTWIKDKILHAYYMTSIEDRLLVERLFNSSLVPFHLPPEERMKKLYYLLATIDDHATRAFLELQKHQTCARRVVAEWLELHRKPASEQRDKDIRAKLMQMSKFLPDQVKALEFLNKFSQHMLKDKPLLMGMETVVNPETSCKECAETTGAILKKLGQPVMTNLYAGTVKMLLERISSVMIDRDALKILIGYVEDCLNGGNLIEEIGLHPNTAGERGLKILVMISYLFPMMFLYKDIFTHLLTLLQMEGESVPTLVMQILTFVGKYHSLYKMFTEEIKVVVPICKNYVETGTPKQAKHAIRCLYNNLDNDDPIFAELLEKIKANLTPSSEHYLTAIVAFGHIAQNLPYKFPAMLKVMVTRKIVKELLVKDNESESTTAGGGAAASTNKSRSNSSSIDSEATWCEEADLPLETRCKVEALKAMARWLIGYKNDKISAQKTFRMLTAFITNKGDLLQNQKLSAAEMAWMRLAAGCAMLKICEQKGVGDQFVAEQFYTLSLLVTDPVIQVRDRFLEKLHNGLARGLPNRCLPLDFMGLYALFGFEQDRKLKSKARKYMIGDVGKRREYIKSITMGSICDPDKAMELMVNIHPDYMVLFAIALLAHSPFFTSVDDIEVLKTLRNCLWYVLEPLMTKNEASSFAFYKEVIDKAKSCRDATKPDSEIANKKLWALCDLLLSLILQKTTNYDFKDLPPEVRIPSMYFKRHEDPHYINTAFYIPGEFWQTDNNKANAGPASGAASRNAGSASTATTAGVAGSDKTATKRTAAGPGGSGRVGRRGRGAAATTNSNKAAPRDDKEDALASIETDAQPASASETKITLLGIEEGGSDTESSQPPLKKTRTDKNSTEE